MTSAKERDRLPLWHVVQSGGLGGQRKAFAKGARACGGAQVKRLRTDVNEAKRLPDEALQLDALCFALRHSNDPSANLLPRDYPVGYAQRLGQALQGNTHVSTIHVHLESMVPWPENGDRNEILEFVACFPSYIASGTAKRVVMHSDHDNDLMNKYLVIATLDAVFGNRRHIRELICNCKSPRC
jgi:hypothetical protein